MIFMFGLFIIWPFMCFFILPWALMEGAGLSVSITIFATALIGISPFAWLAIRPEA